MKTLAEAWNWYEATKRNLDRMRRLGSKHWEDPSLNDASIWQDDHFKMLITATGSPMAGASAPT